MHQPELPPKNIGLKLLLYIIAVLGLLLLGPLALGMLILPGMPSIQLHDGFLSADRSHFEMTAFSDLPGINTATPVQKLAKDREKVMTVFLLTDSGAQAALHILQSGKGKNAAEMIKTTVFDRLNPGVSFETIERIPWYYTLQCADGSLRFVWDKALLVGVFDPSGRNLDPAAFVSNVGIGAIKKQSGPLGRLLPNGWLERNLVWVFPVILVAFAIVWVAFILRCGLWVARIAPPAGVMPEPAGLLREAVRGLASLDFPVTVVDADEETCDICWDEQITYNSGKRGYARYTLRLRLHPETATLKSVFSIRYREKRKWLWGQTINPVQYTHIKKPALAVKNGRIEVTGNKVENLETEVRNALIVVTLAHGWTWQPTFLRA